MSKSHPPRFEARYVTLTDGREEFDELVADNAYVHLECMSDDVWWMRVEVDGEARVLYFSANNSKKKIDVREELE